ncbi:MAG: PIG-L deacetylase family protein [Fibrobacterota bacterium]
MGLILRKGKSIKEVRCKEIFGAAEGKVLFIAPHDDDAVLGAGLMMRHVVSEGYEALLCVVTDGSLGYCSEKDRENISATRKKETLSSSEIMGLKEENIIFLGYPDCGLSRFTGRLPEEDKLQGLQSGFTRLLRKTRPAACFLPTGEDYHPDHKTTYSEFLISLFHASGEIWPEYGPPFEVPPVFETAVYCDFPEPPELMLDSSQEDFEPKIRAVEKFSSQKQIGKLVEKVRMSGPVEFFRKVPFSLYDPLKYKESFKV